MVPNLHVMHSSIYGKSFKDPNVAGACGEMRVALGPNKNLLMNPLVAAQNFEYKISNVLDKPMESVFGFISVLPGAFSAYRYEALLNVNGEGPLEKYFKGEYLHQMTTEGDSNDPDFDDERDVKEKNFQQAGIFTSNMYLAEDRILCFELVAKKNHNYILRYVNEAKAETDVPENIENLSCKEEDGLMVLCLLLVMLFSIGQRFGVPIILCLGNYFFNWNFITN